MKRVILYIGILALVVAAPVKPMNVGNLRPVQIIAVRKMNKWVTVETDTEDKGIGGTITQAIQNMKDRSEGTIYLDTAEYLMVDKEAEDTIGELTKALKPSVRLCIAAEAKDLKKAARFLESHGGLPKLKHWKTGAELPVVSMFEDSYIFLKKVENKA